MLSVFPLRKHTRTPMCTERGLRRGTGRKQWAIYGQGPENCQPWIRDIGRDTWTEAGSKVTHRFDLLPGGRVSVRERTGQVVSLGHWEPMNWNGKVSWQGTVKWPREMMEGRNECLTHARVLPSEPCVQASPFHPHKSPLPSSERP